jgi:murein DD-endopeptidase MepM/ murein hydrolase activator NlpD
VSGIAARFGVASEDIIANNMGVISDQSMLVVGASLQIPAVPGVLHNISVGETLTDIAAAYGATLDDILDFPGNQISDPSNVPVGAQILVVNGHLSAPPAEAATEEEATAEATPEPTEEPTPVPTPPPPPPPMFIWPVVGNITSYFGPSHPLGIDISIAYAPVAASAAGKVVFVGGNPCCSYGYYIDIQHADGYMTRYGHLSKFLVTLGQQVAQGDTIAISGNTGYSTGAHVHFEIRRYGVVQNPLALLP